MDKDRNIFHTAKWASVSGHKRTERCWARKTRNKGRLLVCYVVMGHISVVLYIFGGT